MKKRKMIMSLLALMACGLLGGCGDKSAADYNDEGQAYYDSGDYVRAEECLNRAEELEPSNLSYKQNHAMVLIQTDRIDEAVAMLVSTLKQGEDEGTKKTNKFAYRGIGIAKYCSKDYADAIDNYNQALLIDTAHEWDDDLRYFKACACRDSGDSTSAASLLGEIIQNDATNIKAYRMLADILRNSGDYRGAIENYRNVLKLSQGDFETYIGLAASYAAVGEQNSADEALFQATLLDIKDDEDKYYLGVIHFYQKKYDSAKQEMDYSLLNGFTEAYFYLAEMEMNAGEYDKAVEYFTKYGETNSMDSPLLCNDMAVCCINAKDYEGAAGWIEKGLGTGNSAVQKELKRNEVACLEGLGKLSEATGKLKEYLIDYPDDEAAQEEYAFLTSRGTEGI